MLYSSDSVLNPKKYSEAWGINSSTNSIAYSNSVSKYPPNSFSSSKSILDISSFVGILKLQKKLKNECLGSSIVLRIICPDSI